MRQIDSFFRSNVEEDDHSIYKMFLVILKREGTTIIQKGIDSYILLNEKEEECLVIGSRLIEIIQKGNIIMVAPHDYIREKIIERTKEEIDSKIQNIKTKVDILRINQIKNLL